MSQIDNTELLNQVRNGDRQALAKAITVIENTGIPFEIAESAGAQVLGITGAPGVGKSTTVDALIKLLRERNFSVAVLAVDPSSPISGGALLGDRIRLTDHFTDSKVFIRSLATRGHLGGLSASTKAVLKLTQSAQFDFIIVETVGVGQSEVEVHGMTDFFLLLMLAGAGDQLQGIKRGIMELTDALVITKADGENKTRADHAKAEYGSALHLFPEREDGWVPQVFSVSSIENQGLNEVWKSIQRFDVWQTERGLKCKKRESQRLALFQKQAHDFLLNYFLHDEQVRSKFEQIKQEVQLGLKSPMEAVFEWMEDIKKKEI